MPQPPSGGVLAVAGGLPLVLIVALLGFVVIGGDEPECGPGSSASVDPGSVPNTTIAGYNHEQLVNAAYVIQAGHQLGLSVRDQTIGVMTAMGESSLLVVDHGDAAGPDSRGLFQQRASGWGSYADRMDPYTSATNFFKAMMKIDSRESLEPTIVAHRTQINADPYHYRPFWGPAQQVVAALAKTGTGGGASPGPEAGSPRHYDLGPVKPQTQMLADLLGTQFSVETIGGYREDAFDDHPSGLAIDLMVPGDQVKGQQIADYAQAHAGQLGIEYLIWNQHIWNIARAAEGWRAMADRGSPTANHLDHVHITLKADATVEPPTGGAAAGCPVTGNPGQVGTEGWATPGEGPITSPYGRRVHPITGITKLHSGTDLNAGGCNGPVWAAQAGTVTFRGFDGVGNGVIKIDHGSGVETWYLHMYEDGMLTNVGDHVTAGQQIARVGSSGYSTACHLHFEVHLNGEAVDPVPYMNDVGITLG